MEKEQQIFSIKDIISVKKDNKPSVKSRVHKIAEKVSVTIILALSGSFVYTMANSNYKTNGVPKEKFIQNPFKVPLTLPLTNKDIQFLIDENFSNEQKQCIKNAVEELDVDLTGITYKVELDNSKKSLKSIRINKVKNDNSEGLAVTQVTTTGFFGYINYPVHIDVQIDKIVPQQKLDETYTEYLKGIIKHEMLHTLGFVDIYDSSLKFDTIMYGHSAIGENYLHNLTEKDIEMVNRVYTPANNKDIRFDTRITTPKQTKLEKYVSKDNIDELTY